MVGAGLEKEQVGGSPLYKAGCSVLCRGCNGGRMPPTCTPLPAFCASMALSKHEGPAGSLLF